MQPSLDSRVTRDYPETRPEIASHRIGACGYSMGGTQTFLLTAVESRIKAAVACAAPQDKLTSSLIAPRNVARGIGTRPFLVVMGEKDQMCPADEARQVFADLHDPQAKLSFFPGTHKISRQF